MLVLLAVGACGSSRPAPEGERQSPPAIADATPVSSTAGFHCFSWIRGAAVSTECYRVRPACDAAAKSMTDSGRDVTPCEAKASAWCVLVDDERCFETGGDCARYMEVFAVDGQPLPSCQTRE